MAFMLLSPVLLAYFDRNVRLQISCVFLLVRASLLEQSLNVSPLQTPALLPCSLASHEHNLAQINPNFPVSAAAGRHQRPAGIL
jgi:hypothetical protein